MTDLISFLPMLEPRDTSFEHNARIADIRKMGYNVKTRIVSRNRKNYAEYYMEAN